MTCYRGGVFSVVVTCCSSFAGVVSNLLPDDMLSRHDILLRGLRMAIFWFQPFPPMMICCFPARDDDMLLLYPW